MSDTRSYRAICFDLDGTLLPMDIDDFMKNYYKRICAFMMAHGLDGDLFLNALNHGVREMATHESDESNSDAFWRMFFDYYPTESDEQKRDIRKLADAFYKDDFVHIGDDFTCSDIYSRVLDKLAAKGYPLLLTTMPMFPLQAVVHRLDWAGISPAIFTRITNYSNSKSVKPKPKYFAENLAAAGLRGEDVLMVGNNTMEDMDFLKLGAQGYLITDCLLNPIDMDLNAIEHGSIEDFERWVDELPICEDPISSVETGLIDAGSIEHVLRENSVTKADEINACAKAEAVANSLPDKDGNNVSAYSELKIAE